MSASMRPRHHTAENADALDMQVQRLVASMRPRHHTAENEALRAQIGGVDSASMRPRHHTAENLARIGSGAMTGIGFNEAAASHRGKPYDVGQS